VRGLVNVLSVPDATLGLGSIEERREKQRQANAHANARAIVAKLEEIPRGDLDLQAVGGRLIEHIPTGRFYVPFSGDAGSVGDDVREFYFDAAGSPQMLQRSTSPASRAELEQKRAARDQRKRTRAAEAKARYKTLRKQHGRR
jgi:hypothetical protein